MPAFSVRRSVDEIQPERGNSSSGTENEYETDSACLGDMVARFMEESGASAKTEDLSPLTQTMDTNIMEDCQNFVQQRQFEILQVYYTSTPKIFLLVSGSLWLPNFLIFKYMLS